MSQVLEIFQYCVPSVTISSSRINISVEHGGCIDTSVSFFIHNSLTAFTKLTNLSLLSERGLQFLSLKVVIIVPEHQLPVTALNKFFFFNITRSFCSYSMRCLCGVTLFSSFNPILNFTLVTNTRLGFDSYSSFVIFKFLSVIIDRKKYYALDSHGVFMTSLLILQHFCVFEKKIISVSFTIKPLISAYKIQSEISRISRTAVQQHRLVLMVNFVQYFVICLLTKIVAKNKC